MQPPPVWSQQVVMRSFDVDFRRQATLSTVCRWFLEAAWHDAERLGFGFADLARQGKLWVLSRLLVQVSSYPAWGETVEVRTWPRASRGVFAMREFQMIQSGNQVCACGTSAWLVLDAQSRRPQRAERILSIIPVLSTEQAAGRDPEKLSEPRNARRGPAINVGYTDVDVNTHVNSCRYIDWVLNSYPMNLHEKRSVRLIEANYVGETRAGDVVQVLSGEDIQAPACDLHSLVNVNSNQDLCRLRIQWHEQLPRESEDSAKL